jgi:hypothetical protein
VRISKVVRYTQAFTPRSRFEPDPDTLALYHCDEGRGDFLMDSSRNNHDGQVVKATWAPGIAGGPSSAAARSAVVGNGLEFSGEGSHVVFPKLTASAGPITIEGWFTLASDKNMSLFTVPHADGAGLFRLTVENGGPQAVVVRKSEFAIGCSRSRTLPVGQPFHLAAVTQGGDQWALWLGGKKISERGDRYGWTPAIRRVFPAIVGGDQGVPLSAGQGRGPFQGTVRELRVSNTARYLSEFQPSQRFATDKDTLALYHCDQGTGETLTDSSGNGHDGKIVGAKWVPGIASQ